jgi:hypothetical protein
MQKRHGNGVLVPWSLTTSLTWSATIPLAQHATRVLVVAARVCLLAHSLLQLQACKQCSRWSTEQSVLWQQYVATQVQPRREGLMSTEHGHTMSCTPQQVATCSVYRTGAAHCLAVRCDKQHSTNPQHMVTSKSPHNWISWQWCRWPSRASSIMQRW